MALTGVGPSMASGSQTCRGNWALLPIVPKKINTAMSAIHGTSPNKGRLTMECASWSKLCWLNSSLKRKLLGSLRTYSRIMPIIRMASPMRVVMKALTAAALADAFSYQKPISR